MSRPRFTIRAMLGCTAALCVPLALLATGSELGLPGLVLVVWGCIGYLLGGWNGVFVALLLAVLAIPVTLAIAAVLTVVFQW